MITLYDTTLRDGAQTVGISFSLQDKIKIAIAIDRLRIDYIEGGWPGSNPKDDLFFKEMRNAGLAHSKIVAFGSTKRKGVSCRQDALLTSLIKSGAEYITIVAKSWDFHVTKALELSLKEYLTIIYDTIAFLKDKGRHVFLDSEHFFDGYIANRDFTIQTLMEATRAGADMVVLCDTNGGTLPNDVGDILDEIKQTVNAPIGVHFHNDSGVAVANSIIAVQHGAQLIQGTINGYGERCGNCDLIPLIPNLFLKLGYECNASQSMLHLTEISRYVSEISNLTHNERAPYVGDFSFAHKGGIHVSALRKDTSTYEHIDPEIIGNRRKVLISELSGKSNIEFKAEEMGIDLTKKVTLPREIRQRIKEMEDQGYQFEGAEGSFELLIRQATGEYIPFFILKGFRVITEMDDNEQLECEATIKVEVGGKIEHTAANGSGPVEALDNALRKALEKFYPEIKDIHLTDYKVRVLNEKDGTGSSVRVLIDQKNKNERWGTVGVSKNIIEASYKALVDGIEYLLFKLMNK